MKTAAVTGATGLVGTLACEALCEAGYRIRRLVRQPQSSDDDRAYTLRACCSPDDLAGADVLVHCAYDLVATSRRDVWESNVFGTRRLLNRASDVGVRRTILVSSMSAYPGTRQLYGRAKLASELDALAHEMSVVRLGLVYGPRWGGMVGTLRHLTAGPVVPLPAGESRQFTLHEDDFQLALAKLALAKTLPARPLGLASPDPVPVHALLRGLAASNGSQPRFVRVPWRAAYATMRAAEMAHIRLPARADSLLGLARPAPDVPGQDDLRALGIQFRSFSVDAD